MPIECAVVIFEGTAPVVQFTFYDIGGALANPTAMLVRVQDPDDNVVDYTTPDATITNPSVGVWQWTPANAPAPGTWSVYGAGTAGILAAAEIAFAVKASTVPPPGP
jgi:hypothetical protein